MKINYPGSKNNDYKGLTQPRNQQSQITEFRHPQAHGNQLIKFPSPAALCPAKELPQKYKEKRRQRHVRDGGRLSGARARAYPVTMARRWRVYSRPLWKYLADVARHIRQDALRAELARPLRQSPIPHCASLLITLPPASCLARLCLPAQPPTPPAPPRSHRLDED